MRPVSRDTLLDPSPIESVRTEIEGGPTSNSTPAFSRSSTNEKAGVEKRSWSTIRCGFIGRCDVGSEPDGHRAGLGSPVIVYVANIAGVIYVRPNGRNA